MKLPVMPAALISIIAGGTIPAYAQAPPLTLAQPRQAMSPPDPKAVPGFLDPATGNFTPLARKGANSGETVGGTFHYMPTFEFDPRFSLPTDSIFCTVTLKFGNPSDHFIFANHSTEADFEFSVGTPPKDVEIPYKYTPNSPNAELVVNITCFGFDDSGMEHFYTNIGSPGALPNGPVDFHQTISF
jgi:hypothetical protein